MRIASLLTVSVFLGASVLAACSDSSSDDHPGDLGDSSTPDGSLPDTSLPDTAIPDATPDAPVDSGPEASVCTGDAAAGACCCNGDVSPPVLCSAEGQLSCPAGYQLYHDEDCSPSHPPCGLPGPDAGDAGDASPTGDAGDAGDAGH